MKIKQQRILIFGGSGFLGSELIYQLKQHIVIAPNHHELDLLDINRVYQKIETTQPDVIIYSAGITKIDAAEANKELAFLLNAKIPEKISSFASKHKIRCIYISTDAVFDGTKRKFIFSESDPPVAKSIYGLSKLLGESAVLSKNSHNTIVRLITLYGIDLAHPNFITKIYYDLKKNKKVYGITDQIQNPLFIKIAAEAISSVINKNLTGIYHLGALDYCTNYHFVVKFAEKLNLNTNLIQKVTYNEFFKEKVTNRRKKSVLTCNKFVDDSKSNILRSYESSIEYMISSNKNLG
jgi:dTDP-4-dehydrorhamnose reductase